ncbi:hypothetical protein [Mycobacterium sp. MMS18-G62]
MTGFADEIAAARETTDPNSYITQVKLAVRKEFARIDDTAQLDDTQYFNHSAVPDFIIKWPDHTERRLYLRNSFASIVASGDAVRFNSAKPVVLAISSDDRDDRRDSKNDIAEQSRSAPDTLISDVTAFDAIVETPDGQSGGTSEPARRGNPVAELIRVNLARGGRGLLTAQRVSELLDVQPPDPGQPDSYLQQLEQNFSPESVARISQTAVLVQVALSGDVSNLSAVDATSADLSTAEILSILPWALENPDVTDDPAFWRYIGSVISFAAVMNAKDILEGRDLTRLVKANISAWSGKRAYIGQENLPPQNPSDDDVRVREDGIWSILGPTLGANFRGLRLQLAHTGTALRGRDAKSAVQWADLASALSNFNVSSVNLKGIARSININAEESPDVSHDIDVITRSVDDTYYVAKLGLVFPAADEQAANASVDVNFDHSIISSEKPVALYNLAAAALRLLRYREPIDTDAETMLLGTSFESDGVPATESNP